jgi:site-specific recombinase XerD
MSALSSLFEELVGARQIDFNPIEGVRRPPATVTRPRLGFTDSEVNKILEDHSIDTLQGLNNRTLLAFLFFTGCRISEALTVKVADIENLGNVLVVRLRGKGEKRRTLPLHPKLSKLVIEVIQRRGKREEEFLFTRVKGATGEGGPLQRQNVGKILKRTLKRLGLETNRSLHSSRRTVISNLLESGARIESVAELAGHANINTTQRYNVRQEAIEDNPLLSLKYQD